jgi:hypothetical protein
MSDLHVRRAPADQIRERLSIARLYVAMTRTLHEVTFPQSESGYGAELESLLVALCVFIGDAEGRPMSASKIAIYAGLPRASVYRRLERLAKQKKIIRVGRAYHCAESAGSSDDYGRLRRLLDNFDRR